MATYDFIFDKLGLRDWCGGRVGGDGTPMSMAELLGKTTGTADEV